VGLLFSLLAQELVEVLVVLVELVVVVVVALEPVVLVTLLRNT
jgi:hypothetical protein|tara:strand:- start:76 stop:204 length:129 start_codon:yes stop_codon:yes gene_type:complete